MPKLSDSRIPGQDDEPLLPLNDELAALDDAFASAPLDAPVPDGAYSVHVQRVDVTRAQTSGRPLIKWHLRILGPSSTGRHIWRNLVLSAETFSWLKRDLKLCGVTVERLSDLPPRLEDLAGLELDVRVRTQNGFLDVYFVRARRPEPAMPRPAA